MEQNQIAHEGIVESVNPSRVIVRITAESACAKCHAKGACISIDTKDKIIEVQTDDYASFRIGDPVIVSIDTTTGHKAVILGYWLPFLVLLMTLLIALHLTGNEAIAGISALSAVALYYFVFYFIQHLVTPSFRFYIRHR